MAKCEALTGSVVKGLIFCVRCDQPEVYDWSLTCHLYKSCPLLMMMMMMMMMMMKLPVLVCAEKN